MSDQRWDDGRAEIAYYRLWDRSRGFEALAGAIFVKHHVDPATRTKLDPHDPKAVAAFRWMFLYEGDVRPRDRHRHYFVLDMRQQDLTPLSYGVAFSTRDGQCSYLSAIDQATQRISESADWCTTFLPLELASPQVYRGGTVLPGQVLMLVRALDFSAGPEQAFFVSYAGELVPAKARRIGLESVGSPDGRPAERIEVRYERPIAWPDARAPVGPFGGLASTEVYWRSTEPHRQILRMAAEGYGMELIEEIRAQHWKEDFYPRLRRVKGYP